MVGELSSTAHRRLGATKPFQTMLIRCRVFVAQSGGAVGFALVQEYLPAWDVLLALMSKTSLEVKEGI